MITFRIVNPAASAVSWLVDIETGGTPVFNPQTVALNAPIVMTAPVGSPVSVNFITYSDPVGTSATGTTTWTGSGIVNMTMQDGATYTMDLSTGILVPNPSPVKNNWTPLLVGAILALIFLAKRK